MNKATLIIRIVILCQVFFFISCKKELKETEINKLLSAEMPSFIVYGDRDTLQVVSSEEVDSFKAILNRKYQYKYLLPYSKKNCDLNNLTSSTLAPRESIACEIYIDTLIADLNAMKVKMLLKNLTQIMDKMYLGFELQYEVKRNIDFKDLNTSGIINTDNIKKDLRGRGAFNGSKKIQIYLVKVGDFLSNANAVCMPTGSKDIVMGDGQLLQNPMLLLHEIFHSYELRHSEDSLANNASNIMDIKSIGCSHYINLRQVVQMSFQKYVPFVKNDTIFPKPINCETYKNYNSLEEAYVNTIDNSVVEMPMVGDYLKLFTYYSELLTGEMPADVDSAITHNYTNQAIAFGIKNPIEYVKQAHDSHNYLRQRNLKRWLKVNYDKYVKEDVPMENITAETMAAYWSILKKREALCHDHDNTLQPLDGGTAQVTGSVNQNPPRRE